MAPWADVLKALQAKLTPPELAAVAKTLPPGHPLAPLVDPRVSGMAPRDEELIATKVTGPGTPPSTVPPKKAGVVVIDPGDVGVAKFGNIYRRKLGLNLGSALGEYHTGLFPVLPLGVVGPEDVYPEELLTEGVVVVGQSAAKVSIGQLQNPPKSNRLIIIEAVQVTRHQTAGQVECAITGQANTETGATNFTSYGPRDSRAAPGAGVGLIDGAIPAAIGGAPFFSAIMLASGVASQSGIATIPLAVLVPGEIYQAFPVSLIGAPLVNEGITLNVWAREIALPQVN